MDSTLSSFRFDLRTTLIHYTSAHLGVSFPAELGASLSLPKWSRHERKSLLTLVASWLLDTTQSTSVIRSFRPVLPELVHRITSEILVALQQPAADASIPRYLAAVVALSNVVSQAPQLLTQALNFFSHTPSPLETLVAPEVIAALRSTPPEPRTLSIVEEVLAAVYRFLKLAPKDMSAVWNWSGLFVLAHEGSPKARAFACQCLTVLLGLSDQETRSNPLCKSLLEEATFITEFDQIEAREHHLLAVVDTTEGSYVTAADFDAPLVDVCGFLLPLARGDAQLDRENTQRSQSWKEHQHTATSLANLSSLALAVCKGDPILLAGPTGAGKTHTIQYLAQLTNNTNLIKVHLGDQSDAKVLLGSYVCTDTPGQFKWVPGALTQAVSEGRWIIIEDIDLAPNEVLSTLIPLLERRQLFIPGRGEVITAATGFQIFATQTLNEFNQPTKAGSSAGQLLGNFWTKVVVEPLSIAELGIVLTQQFPLLAILVPKIVETFEMLQSLKDFSTSAKTGQQPASKFSTPPPTLARLGRLISTRDVVKWCRRLASQLGEHLSSLNSTQNITSRVRELVFQEAVDCFCGAVQSEPLQDWLTLQLARCWEITEDRQKQLLLFEKPAIREGPTSFQVGRVTLVTLGLGAPAGKPSTFSYTRHTLLLMERVAQSIQHSEPVLLVGETGAGKTSTLQHLARKLNQTLVVLNMNQQSDSVDLLGGFKPVELRLLCTPLKEKFDTLFCATFSKAKNKAFLDRAQIAYSQQDWKQLIVLFQKAVGLAEQKLNEAATATASSAMAVDPSLAGDVDTAAKHSNKRRKTGEESSAGVQHQDANAKFSGKVRVSSEKRRQQWAKFKAAVEKFDTQHTQLKNSFGFSFVEGALVKAVKKGYWVLLDEINLASQETLESLSGLLEGESLVLSERGDIEPIQRHPSFRLLAAMNPANDVGKKDLPPALRNRFTEFVLRDLTNKEDLQLLVTNYLSSVSSLPPAADIVNLYMDARNESNTELTDGANQKPHYSLRTLSRALEFACETTSLFGFERALVEGFQASFFTQLDSKSLPVMRQLIKKHLQRAVPDKVLLKAPKQPGEAFVQFEQFWLEKGTLEPHLDPRYILTPTIKQHLVNLARVLTTHKYPILLQGPTSAGKTSMIEYLAARTGHRFVRVNNHEHTDLQEYIGQYVSDSHGKLYFQEGILVEAVRQGYWIVLDELNLAPSEVLEALNRLLDDNRELFIPETQQVIKPHPHFMLFATQNPPGLYGGRKVLSRAFRNRFVELHFDDIPDDELEIILRERCFLPQTYSKLLVLIMKDLQRQRQGSQVFAGKSGLVTLRDLFRWAERHPSDYQELAHHGYMLLAERLRNPQEQSIVKQTIEKHLKVQLDLEKLYNDEFLALLQDRHLADAAEALLPVASKIVWTTSAKRLLVLIGNCLRYKEPVLLVGETGTGKTATCQVHAELAAQHLHILNCHQHTETADFIGGLRPLRGKEQTTHELKVLLRQFLAHVKSLPEPTTDSSGIPADLTQSVDALLASVEISIREGMAAVQSLTEILSPSKPKPTNSLSQASLGFLRGVGDLISSKYEDYASLFKWYDGPLVTAMKHGNYILIDEISLAEDAVLERLNSVLEPSRVLTIAEKGAAQIEELIAHDDFRVLATMNPGGDFGKKELSPALRNRFTEIWVPAVDNRADLEQIIEERIAHPVLKGISEAVLNFMEFFSAKTSAGGSKTAFSLRDILAWVDFMNSTCQALGAEASFLNGAQLMLLDGLGVTHPTMASKLKAESLKVLIDQLPAGSKRQAAIDLSLLSTEGTASLPWRNTADAFGLGPFSVAKASAPTSEAHNFTFHCPTTASNLLRLLRALQLAKPILLEGSPGVGKTSLVEALGKACGRRVVRINLSDQTDMLDLLGADLPQDDLDDPSAANSDAKFSWRDGIFLSALKAGDWVLLDEMNLASQSVLEGLNAVLDHRATVFIPELNQSFQCPPTFRIFACQNPTTQGGGRKGLPKSFLNRFTKVFLDKFDSADLLFIASTLFTELDRSMLEKLIAFNEQLHHDTMVAVKYGRFGAPWEFNLRDVLRWCELIQASPDKNPGQFLDMLYLQRMRTKQDRLEILKLYQSVFKHKLTVEMNPPYLLEPYFLQVGNARLARCRQTDSHAATEENLQILQTNLQPLEALIRCINQNWMAILVGPTASGKTSLVRLVAEISGNRLQSFAVNSSVDTTELLGVFEQVDLNRHRKEFLDELHRTIQFITREIFFFVPQEMISSAQIAEKCRSLESLWASHFVTQASTQATQSSANGIAFNPEEVARVGQMLLQLDELLSLNLATPLPLLEANFSSAAVSTTSQLRSQLDKLVALQQRSVNGRFEWIDGPLIKAAVRGDWLLMDNVNFCPGAVLDRLLPLLEPNGFITINERGLVNGEIVKVRPHPNFRIFFTMDPKNGDLSRAMRNRGIEIALFQQDLASASGAADCLALLVDRTGLGEGVAQKMIQFHAEMVKTLPAGGSNSSAALTLRELLQWGALTSEQIHRGQEVPSALELAMEQVYNRSRSALQERVNAKRIFQQTFAGFALATKPEVILASSGFDWRSLAFDSSANRLLANSRVLRSIIAHLPLSPDTPAADRHLAHTLIFAVVHLLETSSPKDWLLRLQWTQHFLRDSFRGPFLARLASLTNLVLVSDADITEAVDHIFRGVMSHQLLQQIATATDSFVASLSGPTQAHWPFPARGFTPNDLRKAEGLFALVSIGASPVFAALTNLFARVEVLVGQMIHHYCEHTVRRLVVNGTKGFSRLTVIEQAYAFEQRKLETRDLAVPISSMLAMFFNSIDQHINTWLTTESASLTETQISLIRRSLRLRNELWDACHTQPKEFSVPRVVLLWRWFRKEFSRLHTAPSPVPAPAELLQTLLQRLDEAITTLITAGSLHTAQMNAKRLSHTHALWKSGGHHFGFHSAQLFAVYSQLQDFIKELTSTGSGLLLSRLSITDRTTLSDAKATLLWLNASTATATDPKELQLMSELSQSLGQLPSQLRQKLSAPAPPNTAGLLRFSQAVDEHVSLHYELKTISQIFNGMLSVALGDELVGNEGLEAARKRSAPLFIQHLLKKSLTSKPTDAAIYQLFRWLRDRAADSTLLRKVLPSLVQEMVLSFQQRLFGTILSEPQLLLSTSATPETLLAALDLTVGPELSVNRFESAFRASAVMPFLVDWGTVTVDGRETKMTQLNSLATSIAEIATYSLEGSVNTEESDWALTVATFVQTLLCYTSTLPEASATALTALLKKLHRSGEGITAQESAEVLRLLGENSDSAFASLLHTNAASVVAQILKLISQRSAHSKGAEAVGLRGHVLALVSWLRLCLFLPPEPFDPVSKYNTKMGHFDTELTEINAKLSVLTRAEGYLTGRATNPQITALQRQVKDLESLMAALRGKVVVRPESATSDSFVDLHASTHTLVSANGPCAFTRVQQLISALHKDYTALPSSAADLAKSNRASQMELTWQSNISQLVGTLQMKFATPYPDVIQPVLSSLLQLKRGLRLVKIGAEYGSAFGQELAVSPTGGAAVALPSLVGQSLYTVTQHIQNLATRLIQFPRGGQGSATSKQVLAEIESSILSPVTFDSIEALYTLNSQENTDRKLRGEMLRLHAVLLRACLNAIYQVIAAQGFISKQSLRCLDRIFTTFVDTFHRMRRDEEERTKAREALFRYRKRAKTEASELQAEQDEKVFRELFPDYFKEFNEMTGETNDPNNILQLEAAKMKNKEDDHKNWMADDIEDDPGAAAADPKAKAEAAELEIALLTAESATHRITDEEIHDLCRLHYKIFSTMRAYLLHLPGASATSFDASQREDSMLQAYKTSTELIKVLNERTLASDMDLHFDPAHLQAIHIISNKLNSFIRSDDIQISTDNSTKSWLSTSSPTMPPVTHWFVSTSLSTNFYTSANPSEVYIMLAPVQATIARIRELLSDEQIGQNEVLLLLERLLQSLLCASIYKPLMHFMTGLEVFLRKADEWESYQPQKYSLQHVMTLTKLVARWRRLELAYWPKILEAKEQEHHLKASKWWFHLYSLLNLSNQSDLPTLQKALEEFIEKSTYGEFPTRLTLMLSFYNQVQTEEDLDFVRSVGDNDATLPELRKRIKHLIYNTYRYYSQFLPFLDVEKDVTRKPVLDKVVDYLKISRVDDASFYRLEKSTEASHRNLVKLAREYEEKVLKQSMLQIFQRVASQSLETTLKPSMPLADLSGTGIPNAAPEAAATPAPEEPAPNPKKKSRGKKKKAPAAAQAAPEPKALTAAPFLVATVEPPAAVQLAPSLSTSLHISDATALHNQIPRLLTKMKKYLDKDIATPSLGDIFSAADSLEFYSTALIERAAELRASRSKTAAAEKRRAMKTLLEQLQRIGVDYHASAVQKLNQKDLLFLLTEANAESPVFRHLTARIVPSKASQLADTMSDALTVHWHKADEYYFRLLARVITMRQVLTQPSKELTVAEVRKLTGFAEFSFHLVLLQRRDFTSIMTRLNEFQVLVSSVQQFAASTETSPQEKSKKAVVALKDQFDSLLVHLEAEKSLLSGSLPILTKHNTASSAIAIAGDTSLDLDLIPAPAAIAAIDTFIGLAAQTKAKLDTALSWMTTGSLDEAMSNSAVLVAGSVAGLLAASQETFTSITQRLESQLLSRLPPTYAKSLRDFVQTAQTTAETSARPSRPSEVSAPEFLAEFRKDLTTTVQTVLVAVQNLRKLGQDRAEQRRRLLAQKAEEASAAPQPAAEGEATEATKEEPAPDFDASDLDDDGVVNSSHKLCLDSSAALNPTQFLSNLTKLNSRIAKFFDEAPSTPEAKEALLAVQHYLAQAAPFFQQYTNLLALCITNSSILLKSLSKFSFVLVSLVTTLFRDGYCTPPETAESKEGDELTGIEGTGMGDGEGEKDVSDQLQDEDKIMGEQYDTDNKPKDNTGPVEKDTGVEMDQDFEGEMHDVKSTEEDDQSQESEEENEHKEDNREMGDINPDKEEVIDERMWNSDEDDEGDDKPQSSDKIEKNAPMPEDGQEDRETEMAAREDDEAIDQPQGKDDKSKESKKDAKQQDDAKDQKEEEGEGGDQEKEDMGESGEEMSGEMPEQDQPNAEDLYEDTHHIQPHKEDEAYDLPEDMELDKDEKGGEDDAGEEGDNPADLPKEGQGMDEDSDGDDEGEPQEDKMDADGPPDQFPELPDMPEDPAQKDENKPVGGDKAVEEAEEKKDEGQEEKENEVDEVKTNLQQKDEEKEFPDAYGVEDDVGLPQQQIKNKVSKDQEKKDNVEDQQVNRDTEDQSNRMDVQTVEEDENAGESRPMPAPPSGSESKNPRRKQTLEQEPNPTRSLGDALKHWKKKLNVVDDQKADETPEEKKPEEDKPADESAPDNANYEYVRDETQAENQTLGAATEEQAAEFDMKDGMFDEEEKKPEETPAQPEGEDKMQIEEEKPSEVKLNPATKFANANKQKKDDKASQMAEDAGEGEGDEDKATLRGDEEEGADKSGNEEKEDEGMNLVSKGVRTAAKDEEPDQMDLDTQVLAQPPPALTHDQVVDMRQELDLFLARWREDPANVAVGTEVWRRLSAITGASAQQLCEQLRLILEPTQKAKLQGDYRTGKRINMRRVITYVASQFRKDKIWLRRTQPNKRAYQVLLAIDDSKSIATGNASELVREATATICVALQRLQVGQISLMKFGEAVNLLHPFAQPFTDETAAHIFPQFQFDQSGTNMEELLRVSIQTLELARAESTGDGSEAQLMFIISDGRFGDKRRELKQWLHRAQERNIFIVFLVMDTLNSNESILDIQTISFQTLPGGAKSAGVVMKPYIDEFPFAYYIILKKIDSLPNILADALRQWFELVQRSGQ